MNGAPLLARAVVVSAPLLARAVVVRTYAAGKQRRYIHGGGIDGSDGGNMSRPSFPLPVILPI
ncbi:MAG TPA: hypothetical protein VHD63_21995 [Ktedonobacteraceae bacterium]|nr:hypothetical protein [Ktedonobacteraceae bacterium]